MGAKNDKTKLYSFYKKALACIAMFAFLPITSYATGAPGGLATDLTIWLKANEDVTHTGDGTNVTAWTDNSTSSLSFSDSGSSPFVYRENFLNFNPTIDNPDGAFRALENLTAVDLQTVTVVTVIDTGTNQFDGLFSNVGSDGPTLRANAGDRWRLSGVSPSDFHNNVSSDLVSYNGEIQPDDTDVLHNGNPHILTINGTATTSFPGGFEVGNSEFGGRTIHGDIAEIIGYGSGYNATDRQRVESYLALKYGITLDQSTSTAYLASDGSTKMWDETINASYNNDIFGIGRDDSSGLDQRVSKSVNDDAILTIALDNDFTSANNDAGRTETFSSDLQFLTFSHDGEATTTLTSDVGYPYSLRVAREWLVQNTGSVGPVNIKIDDLDYQYDVLVDADGDFTSGATSLGTVDESGELTGVTFPDGARYMSLAISLPAPGGVFDNLNLWLDAGSGVVGGAAVTEWTDRSQSELILVDDAGGQEPDSTAVLINFNPSVTFTRANSDGMRVASGLGITGDNTLFSANSISTTGVNQAVIETNNGVDGITYRYNPSDQFEPEGRGDLNPDLPGNPTTETFTADLPHLVYYQRSGSTGRAGINGVLGVSGTDTVAGTFNSLEVGDRITTAGESLDGSIGELIFYNDALSATEVQQVNSYLALKYGITLDQSTSTAYLASDGSTKMWDETINASYNNDIFGIGRDDSSGLDQRVSKSVNDDAILTIALDNDFTSANSDAGRTSTTTDLSFVSIANNDSATTTWTQTGAPIGYAILERVWQSQITGTIPTIYGQFDVEDADYNVPDLEDGTEYYIVIDSDSDSSFSDETPTALTNTSGDLWSSSMAFSDGSEFTLATEKVSPVFLELSVSTATGTEPTATSSLPTLQVAGGVGVATGTIDIVISAASSTATSADYTLATTTISIPAGDYSATTTLPLGLSIVNDDLLESNETLVFSISNPVNLRLDDVNGDAATTTDHIYTIFDEDTATTTIEATDATTSEELLDDATFLFSLDKTNLTGSPIELTYVISGTAQNGVDYSTTTSTTTIADGASTTTVNVTAIDDLLIEGSETIILSLSSADHSRVFISSTEATSTVTVLDDDEEEDEEEEDEEPYRSSGGGTRYSCRDREAINYSLYGKHDPRRCKYEKENEELGDDLQNLVDQLDNLQSSLSSSVSVCQPYLSKNIGLGLNNDSDEVNKLIDFLNQTQGENLNKDGIYNQDDAEAVKRFQSKYSSSVLEVWGLTNPTGYVGLTTRMKINSFMCNKQIQCPLFTEFNSRTENNNTQEVKLTKIFMTELGFYSGPIDTIWGDSMYQSMVNFQQTFSATMLKPWGLTRGTGYKYKTTNKFLNEMVGCKTDGLVLENGQRVEY